MESAAKLRTKMVVLGPEKTEISEGLWSKREKRVLTQ